MSSDVPDWLNELAPRSDDEIQTEVEEDTTDADLMTDLRIQMETSEEENLDESRRSRPPRRTQNRQLELKLAPWQRFFLSILLFLDVAVVGLLFLVMLGRITIPVS